MSIKLDDKTHNLRINQATSVFGPGAMLDFIDQTLMTAHPNYWTNTIKIQDDRLQATLRVNELRTPPTIDDRSSVPFVRFPRWYFCPKCRKFMPIEDWEKVYKNAHKDKPMKIPICLTCSTKKSTKQLVPTGIITICEHGHIDDFPWVKWVHFRNKSGRKEICENPQILMKTGKSNLGLEGIELECSCGAKANMKGAFMRLKSSKSNDYGVPSEYKEMFKCSGNSPWYNKKVNKCTKYSFASQRGASNVYYPKIESSIIIPPYSDTLNSKVLSSKGYDTFKKFLDRAIKKNKLERFMDEDFEDFASDIAKETGFDTDKVSIVLKDLLPFEDSSPSTTTRNQYREEEYEALIGNIDAKSKKTNDFTIEEQNLSDYDIPNFSKIVLVKRLREVRALTGFSRVNPPDNNIFGEEDIDDSCNDTKVISLRSRDCKKSFYPASEVRGEGIFIEINNDMVKSWISSNPKIQDNASILNSRYNKDINVNDKAYRKITPKFLLLHTLAHLIIRELSFVCGYATSSLRERIYCNNSENEKVMSGILVYTASGDSEGTLGGLVRQGMHDSLPSILNSALNRALWCSNDPICIDSTGQGRNSLNLGACHSCTLLPETSCEEYNLLLDRSMLIGDMDNRDIGFFKNLILI